MGKAPSLGVMLLRDIQAVFSKHDGVALTAYVLLTDLWGDRGVTLVVLQPGRGWHHRTSTG